jgi:hypothetical protein
MSGKTVKLTGSDETGVLRRDRLAGLRDRVAAPPPVRHGPGGEGGPGCGKSGTIKCGGFPHDRAEHSGMRPGAALPRWGRSRPEPPADFVFGLGQVSQGRRQLFGFVTLRDARNLQGRGPDQVLAGAVGQCLYTGRRGVRPGGWPPVRCGHAGCCWPRGATTRDWPRPERPAVPGAQHGRGAPMRGQETGEPDCSLRSAWVWPFLSPCSIWTPGRRCMLTSAKRL